MTHNVFGERDVKPCSINLHIRKVINNLLLNLSVAESLHDT